MATTLQRKLKLAGDLAKVQPLMQRFHLAEEPKKRHGLRNVILVSSMIGVVAVVVVLCRRSRLNGAFAAEDDPQVDAPIEDALPTGFVPSPSHEMASSTNS